jgi:hypothetical protein
MSEENSEQNNDNQKRETRLKIEVDRSKELEQFYQQNRELEQENGKLKAELEQSALARFSSECRKYGISEEDPKALDMIKAKKLLEELDKQTGNLKAPAKGETTNFYQNLYEPSKEMKTVSPETNDMVNLVDKDVPVSMMKFSSEENMMNVLKKIADPYENDPRQKSAKAVLDALSKKLILQKNSEFEYEGKLSELEHTGQYKKKGTFKKISHNEEGE